MPDIFNTIPDNFFSPLASPNKIVYWECICKLFSIMESQLSFGVERDVLTDELQYYFEQTLAADMEGEGFSGVDARGKANAMLRALENYGWVEIETDKSYIQRVNFCDYAVKIVKTLLEISEGKQIEYQGYIFAIYSLVRTQTEQPAVVLLQIRENTDLLITGLKNLNSNIKHYIDELTRHSTVAEIMDALFNDYITNIVDKAYHRLLTSDNVSKFRPEILERLESRSQDEGYMEKAAKELSTLHECDEDEARERVYQYLHEIMEAFRNMDEILDEINQKNTQYQRAAINRAKFLLTGSEDIRGQLKEILLRLNREINEENYHLGGIYEIEYMDELIKLFGSGFLDEKSFYSPIEGKKEFQPLEMDIPEPDLLLRQEKIRLMVSKMEKVLSPERIEAYVAQQLGENEVKRAAAFPMETTEDFVKIIYVRLYGQRKDMGYRVEMKGPAEIEGYQFRDFEIWRKK